MKLAEIAGIVTAEHSLIRTSSGKLAYLTKRFDRLKSTKVPMEDLCQLSELPSSAKYDSSNGKNRENHFQVLIRIWPGCHYIFLK